MDERRSIYVAIFASLICHASADCRIEDLDDHCNYTIVCESVVTPVGLPVCAHPNPTLLIKNSFVDTFFHDFYHDSNFSEFVKTFKAVNNHWIHIAPMAFNLINCTHIDLSGNGIKTVDRDSFRSTLNLKQLNLSRNGIDTWDLHCMLGPDIPMNITVLDLSFNLLTDITVEKMFCYPELKKLYLQGNKFSFLPEGVFLALVNLNYLSLSNNQLTTLLGTLDNLRNLTILDVSFNRVKQLSNQDLIDSKSLEQILLSQNEIQTVDFTAFNSASYLQMVDLSNNKMKSLILNFINNTELKYLNFHNNDISVINCTFSPGLKNLMSIDFSLNNVSELPAGAISNGHYLNLLNLSSNYLTRISDVSLKEFNNLTVLDLSHNKLKEIGVKEFNKCVNLKRLMIDNNSVKKIDFENLIDALPQLEVISVGGNLISCQDMSEYYAEGLRNNVSVSAMDKVFDHSNVFGISCDNSTRPDGLIKRPESINLMSIVMAWSGLMALLIAILLISGVWSCISKCRRTKHTYGMEASTEQPRLASELPVESRL